MAVQVVLVAGVVEVAKWKERKQELIKRAQFLTLKLAQ